MNGNKSRNKGKAFELEVRKELEQQGWFVSKWANNVGFNEIESEAFVPKEFAKKERIGYLVGSKPKFNVFTKRVAYAGTGFPDFIVYRKSASPPNCYDVMGVECKMRGYLTKEEKEKCDWLLKNHVFSRILIISKNKKKEVEFTEYGDKK